MNNQEKVTTPSSYLKLHRVNSQTMSSYRVRFSTIILFSSWVSFACFCLVFLFLILVLIHSRPCEWVSDKKILPGQFPEARLLFWRSKKNFVHQLPLELRDDLNQEIFRKYDNLGRGEIFLWPVSLQRKKLSPAVKYYGKTDTEVFCLCPIRFVSLLQRYIFDLEIF